MAKGKNHIRFNLVIGILIIGWMVAVGGSWRVVLSFVAGWSLSTFLFSPDSDQLPAKQLRYLRILIYPYSLLFKHRGVSHSILFGTLTRILYAIILSILIIFFLHNIGLFHLTHGNYWNNLMQFITDFNYTQERYKIVIWGYAGMFCADVSHILLDHVSTFIKRISPF